MTTQQNNTHYYLHIDNTADQHTLQQLKQQYPYFIYTHHTPKHVSHYLCLQNNRLSWVQSHYPTPFYINFCDNKWQKRLHNATPKNEIILKPFKNKVVHQSHIVDISAGLAQDAMLISHYLKRCILCIEQHPVISALVQNALMRGHHQNIQWMQGDAHLLLANQSNIDIIYYDPMYPHNSLKAQVKRPMQVIRDLCGEMSNEAQIIALFQQAIDCVKHSVIVKRPKKAPPLDHKVSHQFTQGDHRLDIYIKAQNI